MRQHERLATESAEEREARLHQLSMCQHERLATESSKERGARLHQMSTHQHGQLKSIIIIVWHLLTYYLLLIRALDLRLAPLLALRT